MYQATIVKLTNLRPFRDPVINRIQLATCLGDQVIVSANNTDGEVGVYFPCDGAIDIGFLLHHNLLHKHPTTGEPLGGFFEPTGRVKALRMHGEKSEGFWCSIDLLNSYYPNNKLKVGDSFSEINGQVVCRKYYTPATTKAGRNNLVKKKLINPQFKEHFDTENFVKYYGKQSETDTYIVTEKLHGSSGRYGYFRDIEYDQHWFVRLVNYFSRKLNLPLLETTGYKHLIGTRRTTISYKGEGKGDTYRFNLIKDIILKKGETLYFEIVGFDDNGKAIMQLQSTAKCGDKDIVKTYGPQMTYRYGCDEKSDSNKNKLYIYRITNTLQSGEIVDLCWEDVKKRAKELGLQTVPELKVCYGKPELESLQLLLEVPSILDNSHIREGICIRVEDLSSHFKDIYKLKGFTFKALESRAKDSNDYIDIEEAS